jgi:hypothetical protein
MKSKQKFVQLLDINMEVAILLHHQNDQIFDWH